MSDDDYIPARIVECSDGYFVVHDETEEELTDSKWCFYYREYAVEACERNGWDLKNP